MNADREKNIAGFVLSGTMVVGGILMTHNFDTRIENDSSQLRDIRRTRYPETLVYPSILPSLQAASDRLVYSPSYIDRRTQTRVPENPPSPEESEEKVKQILQELKDTHILEPEIVGPLGEIQSQLLNETGETTDYTLQRTRLLTLKDAVVTREKFYTKAYNSDPEVNNIQNDTFKASLLGALSMLASFAGLGGSTWFLLNVLPRKSSKSNNGKS